MSYQLCAPEPAYTGVASLLELFEGNFEAVAALLAVAASSIEQDVLRIEAGIAVTNAAAVGEAAHRLKGTSGSISAQRLADISSSIERDARDGSLSRAAALIPELNAAARSLTAAIATFARGAACNPSLPEVS